jgi:prepilin-type N-terminal cleavage/methylation domain-containing protein
MRRRAFTLIEILVAIGIIAILAGILIFGVRSMLDTNKAEATRVTLQALQGMFSEFDAKTRLAKQPQAWGWWGISAPVVVPGTFDFWRSPFTDPGLPTYRRPLDAMDAPGSVIEGEFSETDPNMTSPSEIVRNASRQVLNTQAVMGLLLTMPSNRSALERLSSDRYFIPKWTRARTTSPAAPLRPGQDGVLMTNDDQSSAEDVNYLRGMKVDSHGSRFLCIMDHIAASPPPGGNWVPDATPATPVLMDAWNNPIIFVPATGLRVRLLNGAKIYGDLQSNGLYSNIPSEVRTTIIVSPEGKVALENPSDPTSPPKVVQAGRPFWASAGPDGDFAKGDDNIYSFEK